MEGVMEMVLFVMVMQEDGSLFIEMYYLEEIKV